MAVFDLYHIRAPGRKGRGAALRIIVPAAQVGLVMAKTVDVRGVSPDFIRLSIGLEDIEELDLVFEEARAQLQPAFAP